MIAHFSYIILLQSFCSFNITDTFVETVCPQISFRIFHNWYSQRFLKDFKSVKYLSCTLQAARLAITVTNVLWSVEIAKWAIHVMINLVFVRMNARLVGGPSTVMRVRMYDVYVVFARSERLTRWMYTWYLKFGFQNENRFSIAYKVLIYFCGIQNSSSYTWNLFINRQYAIAW